MNAEATGPIEAPTESRSQRTIDIDITPTIEAVGLIIDEEAKAATAVRDVIPQIATIVDEAAARYRVGGNIHYFGAGTSGRIGMLDAAEIHVTYGIETGRVFAHHPNGSGAFDEDAADLEDDTALGRRHGVRVTGEDIVIGLSASGGTPYVRGAIDRAREVGAYTALISSVPGSALGAIVDAEIVLRTGAEAITGSTRMKAGTALKMALNAFSTATMVRLNRTYSNLMVCGLPLNAKGEERMARAFAEFVGLEGDRGSDALRTAEGDMRVALVMHLGRSDLETAKSLLEETDGSVRRAIELAEQTAGERLS